MNEVTMYEVDINGHITIQSNDEEGALNKAKEWVEGNAGKLTYLFTKKTGLVEPEEE